MTYTIEPIDINDPATELEIRQLIKRVYQYPDLFPEKHLVKQVESKGSKPSLFLVAKEGGKIIGCNAFVATDCILNQVSYTVYLSCWTVTHPDHQGKGIFSNLINEAKKILKDMGAGFIYGIANEKSNPIMTKKLFFTEIPAVYLRIPNIPLLRNRYFTKAAFNTNNAIMLDEAQIEAYKHIQCPDDVKIVRHNNSWAWGKLIKKAKWGITIPAFYIGGISLAEGKDLPNLIRNIFSEQKALVIQITSCKNSSFNSLLKNWKPSMYMNGFIYFNLNMPHFDHFNVMIGAIDVF